MPGQPSSEGGAGGAAPSDLFSALIPALPREWTGATEEEGDRDGASAALFATCPHRLPPCVAVMQRPPPRTAFRSRFSAAAPAGPEAGSYALAEGAAPSPKETPEEFRARLAREKAARAERVAALRKAQGRTPKPLPGHTVHDGQSWHEPQHDMCTPVHVPPCLSARVLPDHAPAPGSLARPTRGSLCSTLPPARRIGQTVHGASSRGTTRTSICSTSVKCRWRYVTLLSVLAPKGSGAL